MKVANVALLFGHLALSFATKTVNASLLPGYGHQSFHHAKAFNSSLPAIPSSNATSLPANPFSNATSLLPPYYRNVTTGGAWVLPASPYDLGARAMTCECFDPEGRHSQPIDDTSCLTHSTITEICCIGSPLAGPFCVPKGATCCSSTLCEATETCCADYCCRSVCSLLSPPPFRSHSAQLCDSSNSPS